MRSTLTKIALPLALLAGSLGWGTATARPAGAETIFPIVKEYLPSYVKTETWQGRIAAVDPRVRAFVLDARGGTSYAVQYIPGKTNFIKGSLSDIKVNASVTVRALTIGDDGLAESITF